MTAKLKDVQIEKLKSKLQEHESTIREFEQFVNTLRQGGEALGVNPGAYDSFDLKNLKVKAEVLLKDIQEQIELAARQAWNNSQPSVMNESNLSSLQSVDNERTELIGLIREQDSKYQELIDARKAELDHQTQLIETLKNEL